MRIETVHARDHLADEYRDYLDGHRAVRLLADDGTLLGELVWRVASGHNIEITEFGVFDGANRRQGLGTRLLAAGFADMRQYFSAIGHRLWKVFLFCEASNEGARAFYEARGFAVAATLKGFYDDGDAVMYGQDLG